MSNPEDQKEAMDGEGILENVTNTPTSRFNLLAMASRAAVAAIAITGGFWAAEAQADETADIKVIDQAAQANNEFKVMMELIKMSGKGYQFAGPQKDKGWVECAKDMKLGEAKKKAEGLIKEGLKENYTLEPPLLSRLANQNWVVCVTGRPKQTSATAAPATSAESKELKLEPLPDPKQLVFQTMGELIREFGSKYRFAGPQTDKAVIECGEGKNFKQAKKKAVKLINASLPNAMIVEVKKRQLKKNHFVVAVLARPTAPVGQTRGTDAGQAASIGHIHTSGSGEVAAGEKGKERRREGPQDATQEEGPQAISTDQLPKKLTQQMRRQVQKAFEGTLKQWNSFSGKMNITFQIKDGKVKKITVTGKQPKPMLMNFERELLSKFTRLKFPKEVKAINLPLVLTPKY